MVAVRASIEVMKAVAPAIAMTADIRIRIMGVVLCILELREVGPPAGGPIDSAPRGFESMSIAWIGFDHLDRREMG